ncbi:MAG: M12 family metallopeptidase [Myxococcota bacterium]|nr:M12 family metallopeptidase [Myxococcota bacterium]
MELSSRPAGRLRHPTFASCLVLLALATVALVGCDERPRVESGWLPLESAPRWARYEVRGAHAIYEGDVVFDLDELRAFQALLADRPHPVTVVEYSGPNGTLAIDRTYSGDGDAETPSQPGAPVPLSGGIGVLTDGRPAFDELVGEQGFVSWHHMEPTLTFRFDAEDMIDALELTVDVAHQWWDCGYAVPCLTSQSLGEVVLRVGDTVVVRRPDLDIYTAERTGQHTVRIEGAGGTGLGLHGDEATLTLRPTDALGGIRLAEVEFVSGTVPPREPGTVVQESNISYDAWSWDRTRPIPYEIVNPGGWDSDHRQKVDDALAEWQRVTPVRFVPSSTAMPRFRIFDSADADGFSCYTDGAGAKRVYPEDGSGAWDWGIREMHVVPACRYDTVLHELGHIIGLNHEQQRSDAARNVTVLWDNIGEGAESAFQEKGAIDFGSYDYLSIMQYPNVAFGKRYCCTDPDNDMTQEGAPAGCALRGDVGIDTDMDGEADRCPSFSWGDAMDLPFAETSHTLTVRRDVPSEIARRFGRFDFLSKADIAAVEAMYSGERFDIAGHNALSDRVLQGFAAGGSGFRTAHLNDDEHADLIAMHTTYWYGATGNVRVALGQPDGTFVDDDVWIESFCTSSCAVGDVDGDGLDDVVAVRSNGSVEVATSTGDRFVRVVGASTWHDSLGEGLLHLADLNGDCRDDLVSVRYAGTYGGGTGTIRIRVALSEPGRFSPQVQEWYSGVQLKNLRFGDVDKDGDDDLVGNPVHAGDAVLVYRSDGAGFEPGEVWGWAPCSRETCLLNDVDGDERADLIVIERDADHNTQRLRFRISNGRAFLDDPIYHELDCQTGSSCLPADIDGDGLVEIVEATGVDVIKPFPQRYNPDYALVMRSAGDVWVSRVDKLWMDDLGPRYGGGLGIFNPGNRCLDPELGW